MSPEMLLVLFMCANGRFADTSFFLHAQGSKIFSGYNGEILKLARKQQIMSYSKDSYTL